MPLPGLLGPVVVLAALCAGWLVSRRLAPSDGRGQQLGRALIIGYLLGLVATRSLLALGVYRWYVALPLALAGLYLARSAVRQLLEVVSEALDRIRGWSRETLALAGAWLLLVLVGAARLIQHGPMGWDGITYHLVHAGHWVGTGGWQMDPAPDAWSYYAHYPTGGDVFWALFMLGDGTADQLFVGTLLAYIGACFACALAVRELHPDVDDEGAVRLALLTLATPATMTWVGSQYVDVLMLTFAALGFAFAWRLHRTGAVSDALAAGGAVTICIAIKGSSLLLLPGLLLAVLASGSLRAMPWALAPLLVQAPLWVGNLLTWGNPVYPIDVPVLGGGNALYVATMSGKLHGFDIGVGQVLWSLIRVFGIEPRLPIAGLSSIGWLVLLAGILGALTQARRDWRAPLALGLFGIPFVVLCFLPGSRGVVTVWLMSSGRLLLATWFAAVLALPWLGTRAFRALPLAIVFALIASSVGIFRGVTTSLIPLALLIAAIGLGGWLAAKPGRWAGLPVLLLALTATVTAHCERIVFDIDSARLRMSPPPETYAGAWDWLKRHPGADLAVAAEFRPDWSGHNVFRYRLLGRYAQHRLTYVSPWKSGEIHDGWRPPTDDALSAEAWRSRLVDQGVELVYVQGDVAEREWAERWLTLQLSHAEFALYSVPEELLASPPPQSGP